MTPDNPSLYEVLGIPPQASPTQIKEAWRTTAKATHPDAGGTNEAFTTAQHAWEVLSIPNSVLPTMPPYRGRTPLTRRPLTALWTSTPSPSGLGVSPSSRPPHDCATRAPA